MMKVLLVIHGAVSVVLMGSATHHGLCARNLWADGPVRERLLRVYRGVLFFSYIVVGGMGLWLYPSFRTGVRTPQFDAQHSLVHAFFEVKEYCFLFGLLCSPRSPFTSPPPVLVSTSPPQGPPRPLSKAEMYHFMF